MLRASAGRSAGLQPALLRSATCPYSAGLTTMSPFLSTSPPPSKPLQLRLLSTRPTVITYAAAKSLTINISRRHSSTRSQPPRAATPDAEIDAKAAEEAAKAAKAAHPEQVVLDWNTFFQLRKARRRWQSAFSILSSVAGGFGGAAFLSTGMADSVVSQIPLDPLITLGLLTLSCAALGWLVGPSLGTAVFNTLKSKYKGPMAIKESEFFARIKKHRVDPSASSVRNPGQFCIPFICLLGQLLTGHSTRFLWRKDLQRGRLPAVAEGPESL